MELITVLKYDDYVNDLTKEMDQHLLDGYQLNKVFNTYLWHEFREDGVAIRYPGATRGHIEYDHDKVITNVVIYDDTGTGRLGCYKDSVREAVKQFIGAKIVIKTEREICQEGICIQPIEDEKREVVVVGHGVTGRKAVASLLALTTVVEALGGQGAYSHLNDMPKLPKYNPVKDRRVYDYIPKNAQGRNERCACGSGKKYKRCCGV